MSLSPLGERARVSLSPLGERANSWLGSPPSKEKRNKNVAGNSSILIVGNLDGEEQSCI